MRKKLIAFLLCVSFIFSFSCCGLENEKDKKVKELSFTVVRENDIPKEFAQIIQQKKSEKFELTYEDGDLYIAVGYGEKSTGGYSIEVKNLYLGENAVYLQTGLIGPKKNERVEEAKSYPYIVLKTERRNEKVVFKN